jgi:hypothetical protein
MVAGALTVVASVALAQTPRRKPPPALLATPILASSVALLPIEGPRSCDTPSAETFLGVIMARASIDLTPRHAELRTRSAVYAQLLQGQLDSPAG